MEKPSRPIDAEPETLQEQARNSLDEARMVLPGIQAVFGFQLIAVFNARFERLDVPLQFTHLVSLCLVVLAMALLMPYRAVAGRLYGSNGELAVIGL